MMLYVIHFFLYVRKPFQHYGCGGFVRHCTLQNFNQKNIVGEILARLGQMERIDILDKDLTYTVDNRSVIKQITNLWFMDIALPLPKRVWARLGQRKENMVWTCDVKLLYKEMFHDRALSLKKCPGKHNWGKPKWIGFCCKKKNNTPRVVYEKNNVEPVRYTYIYSSRSGITGQQVSRNKRRWRWWLCVRWHC